MREWESFALTEWPYRYGADLPLWAAPEAGPGPGVAWDMRGHSYEFAKAAEVCHAEIVEGAFTRNGDSRVTRHVTNARRRPYTDAVSIGKASAAPRRRRARLLSDRTD